jgi:hypothetical protein
VVPNASLSCFNSSFFIFYWLRSCLIWSASTITFSDYIVSELNLSQIGYISLPAYSLWIVGDFSAKLLGWSLICIIVNIGTIALDPSFYCSFTGFENLLPLWFPHRGIIIIKVRPPIENWWMGSYTQPMVYKVHYSYIWVQFSWKVRFSLEYS